MARLLTIQELRVLAPFTQANEDEALMTLDAVCEAFESSTRRTWLKQTGAELTFRPTPGEPCLFPRLYPILTLTSIQENDFNEDPVDVDATLYDAQLAAGIIERIDGQSWKNVVKIVVTGGYDVDDIPPDVKQAIGIEVRRRLERDQPGQVSLSSQAVSNSGSTQFVAQENWHPEFRRACNRYRRLCL